MAPAEPVQAMANGPGDAAVQTVLKARAGRVDDLDFTATGIRPIDGPALTSRLLLQGARRTDPDSCDPAEEANVPLAGIGRWCFQTGVGS